MLANFTKHKSITSMNRELTTKIFILMYLNTGILMVSADLDIPIWPLTYFVVGDRRYKDTAKEWFVLSGNAILALMVLNVMWYCLVNLLKSLYKKVSA